jgi:hypothetical protein
VFVRRPVHPQPDLATHPGIWREADSWPPPGLATEVFTSRRDGVEELDVVGDVGVTAWISCAGTLPWGQPLDQRADDARSLTHDWPITGTVELAGHPAVSLRVRASAPVAHLGVKLCDVLPGGPSALITRGMLNLTHRGCWPADPGGVVGRAPSPLVPGEWVDVAFPLEATTWTLEPGHRLRLSIAGTDWPNCWPPPTPVRLAVDWSRVRVTLPVWGGARPAAHEFRPGAGPSGSDDGVEWRIEHDVLGRETRAVTRYGGRYDGHCGAAVEDVYEGTVGVSTVDPGRAWARGHSRFRIEWPEAACGSDAVLDVRSDATTYHVSIELTTTRDGEPFASRSWHEAIPRRLQ